MNRLTEWLVRRIVMKKIKAFFGGLLTPSTSEFWLGWGAIGMKALCMTVPAACAILTTVAGVTPFETPEIMLGSMLAYSIGRMTSKAAKAT